MSIISEQVKELRKIGEKNDKSYLILTHDKADIILQAADTIEALSAKASAANMEQPEKYNVSSWKEEIENKILDMENTVSFDDACEPMDVIYKVFHVIDEYQDAERPSANYGDGWIYCGDGKNMPVQDKECMHHGRFKKCSNSVLVTIRFSDGEKKVDVLKIIDGKWEIDSIGNPKIIAWMPFPKSYNN